MLFVPTYCVISRDRLAPGKSACEAYLDIQMKIWMKSGSLANRGRDFRPPGCWGLIGPTWLEVWPCLQGRRVKDTRSEMAKRDILNIWVTVTPFYWETAAKKGPLGAMWYPVNFRLKKSMSLTLSVYQNNQAQDLAVSTQLLQAPEPGYKPQVVTALWLIILIDIRPWRKTCSIKVGLHPTSKCLPVNPLAFSKAPVQGRLCVVFCPHTSIW